MTTGTLSRRELALALFFGALALGGLLGPRLVLSSLGGAPFADARHALGLPNALDVLSNLPFALLGLVGLYWVHRNDNPSLPNPPVAHDFLDCAWMFFAGLVLTSAASAFYHLQPDAVRLAADRAGMAVAFAGLVGCAVCERISTRAGWAAAWATLIGALAAVAVFFDNGNEWPWAVVQGGGMVLVMVLAFTPAVPGASGLRLLGVIACYGLAKLFELADHPIYEATGHLVSGHSLKHLAAALAAWPLLVTLRRAARQAEPRALPARPAAA